MTTNKLEKSLYIALTFSLLASHGVSTVNTINLRSRFASKLHYCRQIFYFNLTGINILFVRSILMLNCPGEKCQCYYCQGCM